ncbi:MAG TPA: cell division protein FtsZ, partial [Caldisericia bacterium]|nr:cell division protein FtsZ [Caldisericia bacterium]
KAMQIINQTADTDVNSIFGVTIDEELGDQIKIVLIATSFQPKYTADKQLYDLDKDLISSEDLKIPSFLRKKKKEEE